MFVYNKGHYRLITVSVVEKLGYSYLGFGNLFIKNVPNFHMECLR